jgi:hypothetical protein
VDLIASKSLKYGARREKDLAFTQELARRGIVARERLMSLLEQTPVSEAMRERIRGDIARDFRGSKKADS